MCTFYRTYKKPVPQKITAIFVEIADCDNRTFVLLYQAQGGLLMIDFWKNILEDLTPAELDAVIYYVEILESQYISTQQPDPPAQVH